MRRVGTAGWEGAEEAISGRALAEEPSQPVSGACEREERILMQRCCSGSGRAHTYAPSPAAAAPGQPVAKAGGAKQPGGWRQGLLTGWQQHCPSQHPSRTPGISPSPADSSGAGLWFLPSGLCLCLKHPPWGHTAGKSHVRCCWCWLQWPWSPLQVR
ncbi:hypothetical protein U0070_026426, partial [Myodes glareolus]